MYFWGVLYFMIFFRLSDTQPHLATATRTSKSNQGKREWGKGTPCDPVARGEPIGGGGRWTNSPLSLSLGPLHAPLPHGAVRSHVETGLNPPDPDPVGPEGPEGLRSKGR